jgi:hypothetical protein
VKNEEHPAVELLEQFALRRLKAEEMWKVLRHLDSCATCREALRSEYEYIDVIRAALRRLE